MSRAASQSASASGGLPSKARRTPSRRTWSPLSAWLGLVASQKAAAAAARAAGSLPSGSIPWTVLSNSPCRSSAAVVGRSSSSKLSKRPSTAESVPSGSTIAVASRTASEIVGIVSRLPGFTRATYPLPDVIDPSGGAHAAEGQCLARPVAAGASQRRFMASGENHLSVVAWRLGDRAAVGALRGGVCRGDLVAADQLAEDHGHLELGEGGAEAAADAAAEGDPGVGAGRVVEEALGQEL